MLEFLKRHFKNEKGLSLVELLAVIVILGIVAAIAIPAIGNIIENQRDKAILAEAANILNGAQIALTDGACKATANTCSQTELAPFIEGVTSGSTYSATFNPTDNEFTVTFSEFSKIKSKKYLTDHFKGTAPTSLKRSELNAALEL